MSKNIFVTLSAVEKVKRKCLDCARHDILIQNVLFEIRFQIGTFD